MTGFLPSDVGDYFGLSVNTSIHVPDFDHSADIYDRSSAFSSSESYVASIWESVGVRTPPTPENYTVSPLVVPADGVVGSNYDPTLHFDKFWLFDAGLQSESQFIAQPLINDEVIETEQEGDTPIEV